MDVCPVGAITTRDYRFKSRPWDNPQRRRHDLHALREGLQHDGLDQGEARVGEGRAAHPHDAAAQPGRQQLLDVRHRPLRLPLGRKRPPAAAAAPAPRHVDCDAVPWADALIAVKDAVDAAGGPASVRFLVVGARVARRAVRAAARSPATTGGVHDRLAVRARSRSRRTRSSRFRPSTRRTCAARAISASPSARPAAPADVSALQGRGRRRPGQACSTCSIRARTDRSATPTGSSPRAQAGKIQTLIVQGVLHTPLADAADIVLPGSAFVEKDATYTNMTGHVQAASRVDSRRRATPAKTGRFCTKLGGRLRRRPVAMRRRTAIREAIARELGARPGYAALADVTFSRPVSARHWLQASNPSERWKWDFMFQDLPPIKFGEDFGPAAARGRHSAERSQVT